jgi:hypothetical protein
VVVPSEPSEIKGVWLVTARAYVLDRHGRAALERIASSVDPSLASAVLEPLPSHWYPEAVLQQSLRGMKSAIAHDSDDGLLRVMEGCTELGISRFFRALLRLSSPDFVMAQVPTMWRQIRRGPGKVSVERTADGQVIHYTSFPYFDDPNYRLLTLGSLTAVLRLCTKNPPRIRLGAQGKDFLDAIIESRASREQH